MRKGKALRCHFLVPTLPARNLTPDELSRPSEPDWLNPDYGDDEDETGPLFTVEDGDTADIELGKY